MDRTIQFSFVTSGYHLGSEWSQWSEWEGRNSRMLLLLLLLFPGRSMYVWWPWREIKRKKKKKEKEMLLFHQIAQECSSLPRNYCQWPAGAGVDPCLSPCFSSSSSPRLALLICSLCGLASCHHPNWAHLHSRREYGVQRDTIRM